MKANACHPVPLLSLCLALTFEPLSSRALTQGDYTYTVTDGKATITGFNPNYSGALNLVEILGRYPVTGIGTGAFQYVGGITSVTIPDCVRNLEGYAFRYCTNLASVVIGNGVRDIGTYAFSQCPSLTRVTIPDSVTNIGVRAFATCINLARVTIPASVIHIGDYAFRSSDNLSEVCFCGNAPSLGTTVFYSSSKVVSYRLAGAAGWPAVPGAWANHPTALWTLPPATTGAATKITPTAATLTGTANPGGFASSAQFEYGLTTNYGNTVNAVLVPDNGTNMQSVGVTLSGLQSATLYHYRLAITNSQGAAFGTDADFTTSPAGLSYWEHKYYSTNAVPWDTTSSVTDMDAEVALGAVLLNYPGEEGYVCAEYHQYGSSCGPSSMTMVLKALGYTKPSILVSMPVDVDETPGSGGATCSANFFGSMEHLMWLGYHRRRLQANAANWNDDEPQFMTTEGVLCTNWISSFPAWSWCKYGPAVGITSGTYYGLKGIMNYVFANRYGLGCRDTCQVGASSATVAELTAFKRIVKGFIDHGIPVVAYVESGGHFNTLMGYRGDPTNTVAPYYIYTADPLDGWGRSSAATQPGTWRRIQLTQDSAGSRLIGGFICWNQHLNGGCETNGWATEVDRLNGNTYLTGRPVPPEDPLGDALAQPEIRLRNVEVNSGCPSLCWESTRGTLSYTVESCSSLSAGVWLPCTPTNQWPVLTNVWNGFALGSTNQQFYRVVVKEPVPVAP